MTDELVDGVLAGDRRTIAKAITLVESARSDDVERAGELVQALLPHTGGAVRVGVSGPPGVGKSTLLETLGLRLVEAGRRVAVLAVDPSSARTGGSILGDKTRMADLGRHPDAFIRPSPSRGHLGGVNRATREVLLVCEAAGYDVVLVETVGVGQSEVAVSSVVDTFVLLASPVGGDELQGVKRGIIELADVLAVTKSDGELVPAAGRAEADLRQAVGYFRPRLAGWVPPVVRCSAITGDGIDDVWDAVMAHRAALERAGAFVEQRSAQAVQAMWAAIDEALRAGLRRRVDPDRLTEIEAAVAGGTLAPGVAAADLVG